MGECAPEEIRGLAGSGSHDVLNNLLAPFAGLDVATRMRDDHVVRANAVDLGLSVARSRFDRGEDAQGLAVLRSVVAHDRGRLEAYFTAWQSGGEHVLDRLVEGLPTTPLFARDLRTGLYHEVLADLRKEPTTRHGKQRLAIVVAHDLAYADLFTHLSGEPEFIGRIHEPELALSLEQARAELLPSRYALLEHLVKLGKDIRTFYLGGTRIEVSSDRVFGPAIDTLFFIRGLMRFADAGPAWPTPRRILELGSGSGAVLFALADRLTSDDAGDPLHAIATDVVDDALEHSEHLFVTLSAAQRVSLTTIKNATSLRTVRQRYGDGSVDVMIMNPPYIPTGQIRRIIDAGLPLSPENLELPPELWGRPAVISDFGSTVAITRQATEDIDLYVQGLLEDGPRLLDPEHGIMFMLTSSTSERLVQLALQRSPLTSVTLDTRADVPLDVPEVTSTALRAQLFDLPGVSVDLTDPRHPLRHSLRLSAVFHPGSSWAGRLDGS